MMRKALILSTLALAIALTGISTAAENYSTVFANGNSESIQMGFDGMVPIIPPKLNSMVPIIPPKLSGMVPIIPPKLNSMVPIIPPKVSGMVPIIPPKLG